jgi:thiol:disulfide interchange protein DsbC
MRLVLLSFAVLLLTASVAVHGGPAAPSPAPTPLEQARSAFQKRFPTVKPADFRATPLPGVYEVTLGMDVLYVSGDARYLVRGALIGLDGNDDLTERRRAELRRSMLATVPESQMIVFRQGAPKYSVTVLTDVDCGYCRKLHSEIAEYNRRGIEVRYLFFPRAGLGSESWQKAQDVWCAKDRNAALTAAKKGTVLPHLECDAGAVATGYRIGEAFRLSGTPMIISADGFEIGGYLTPAEMQERLDALATKPKAKARG